MSLVCQQSANLWYGPLLKWWSIVWMRRLGWWFAVKMVGADVVGVVWLPKFPRTSAEFPPSAAATDVPAAVVSQCQVGSQTSFHGLHYVGLCILSRNRMLPSPNFILGTIFPRNKGISRKRETQRSDKASSVVESQCRAAEQRGF